MNKMSLLTVVLLLSSGCDDQSDQPDLQYYSPKVCAPLCSPYKTTGFKPNGYPGCLCSFDLADGGTSK